MDDYSELSPGERDDSLRCSMKKVAHFLLKQYKKLSGDAKVRIALKLSKTVRRVRKAGIAGTGV